ncbi:MAG: Ig-like domain-containing protein [Bacilli bacterium]|nr:Ig-like domain-containing protein [Bacilli bacterium]
MRVFRTILGALASLSLLFGFGAAVSLATSSPAMEADAVASAYRFFTFGPDHNQMAVDSYDYSWASYTDGHKVTLDHFSNNINNWDYIKCGRYSRSSVATIVPEETMAQAINRVIVKVTAIDYPQYINSQKLYIASNSSFTQNVQTVTLSPTVGDNIFYIPNPTANMYYKIEYDLQGSSASNQQGFITISEVDFFQGTTPAVSGVSLNRTSATVRVNETFVLTASITPANAGNKAVLWNFPGNVLERVSTSGQSITLRGSKAGSTTVTVTTKDGYLEASCEVTVETVAVTRVSLNQNSLLLYAGESAALTAIVTPANASNKNCAWYTTNSGVATVNQEGRVVAVGAGTTKIQVITRDGYFQDECDVRVLGTAMSTPYASPCVDTITYDVMTNKTTTEISFSNSTFGSGAKYSGSSSADSNYIILRSAYASLIRTTSSSGTVRRISITWDAACDNNARLYVYANSSSLSSKTEYASKGVLLGSLVKGVNDELEVDVSAKYVCLFPYQSTVKLDRLVIEWQQLADTADALAVNTFIQGYMHLDYTEESPSYDPGAMKCKNENWYADAKIAFESLTDAQKEAFLATNLPYGTVAERRWTYADVLQRLCVWANKNGEDFNTSTGVFGANRVTVSALGENQESPLIALVALIGATTLFGVFFLARGNKR